MHKNSHNVMRQMLNNYLLLQYTNCIDIGSYNVNGTYKQLILDSNLTYTGIDIELGPNVDLVVPEYDWSNVGTADVVISGNCLEHVKQPWTWILQASLLLNPNGLLVVVTPWSIPIHRYPVDCWRILPDGMQVLFDLAGLQTLEVGTINEDCYGVARLI